MKNISKKVLLISFLLIITLAFFNKIESEIWLSIRIPLLGGLILALIITIPEINFNKITSIFRRIFKK